MYFIRYQSLKERLKNRTVTDKEALSYLILFCVLEVLMVSFPFVSKLNKWDIVGGVLNIIITIVGVLYVYRKNNGSSGYDIIQKFVVLGWVVVVRYFIIIVPVGIIIYMGAEYFFDISGNETTLFDVVLLTLASAIYYERLGRHIADTNDKNSEPVNTADR